MAPSHACCQPGVAANMTPNRQKVWDLLQASERPLSAYEVLDRLRLLGTNWQPPTVYRALDYLVAHGFVHYLQSIQKFVPCPHQVCDHFSQLLICVKCGQVQEVPLVEGLVTILKGQAALQGFTLDPQFLELKGVCHHCGNSGAA